MKKVISILIMVFLLVSNIIVAQNNKNETKEKPAFAVAAVKMNVVYVGLENPVTIAVSSLKPDKFDVVAEGASIKKVGNPGQYIIYNIVPGTTVVNIVISKKGKELGREAFRVKLVPPPVLRLGNILTGGKATIDQLINTEIVASPNKSFPFEINQGYKVISFCVVINIPGGVPQKTKIEGNKLSNNPQIVELIRNTVKPGDVFTFSDFKIQSPSGVMDDVWGISYLVY